MAGPGPTLTPWTPTQERIGTVAVRIMSVLNTLAFRVSGGRIGGRFLRGAPVCLLTTTGARSGTRRTTPLLYLEDGADIVVVASKGGMSHSPAWYFNLMKHPDCEVEVPGGGGVLELRARRASDAEKAARWPKLLAIYPDYADYQARTSRNIPVMILSPREGSA
jgi:deazaflavin-dependent oxidoreductase (nitroreductase family)